MAHALVEHLKPTLRKMPILPPSNHAARAPGGDRAHNDNREGTPRRHGANRADATEGRYFKDLKSHHWRILIAMAVIVGLATLMILGHTASMIAKQQHVRILFSGAVDAHALAEHEAVPTTAARPWFADPTPAAVDA